MELADLGGEAGMPYDEDLDTMIRAIVEKDGMARMKMFGGTCYLMGGKMVCGVWKGWIMIDRAELAIESVEAWIEAAKGFVATIEG